MPPAESPRPSLGYLPAGLARKSTKPHTPPVAPSEAPMAPPAAPEVPVDRPASVAPANLHPEPAPARRRSPRLHPEPGQAHAILGRPSIPQPQSQPRPHTVNSSSHQRSPMARVYPLTIGYREALGPKANPLSFASLRLVNLRNGRSQYLSTLKQLADALPKTEDPTSRFALRGHIARPGQHRLRRSMRDAIWFLLPSDEMFLRDSSSLRYCLAHQGRRAVLRGGDVTGRPWENTLNWVPGPAPATSRDHSIEQLPLRPEPERPKEQKENRPPASHTPRLPRKLRSRRIRRAQKKHPLPVTNENLPGTDLRPGWMKRTPQKHPKHPLPVAGMAKENLPGANLWNLDAPGRLYKQAQRSRIKQFSKRPRRDYFSGSPLPLHSKRPRRDYFSETSLHPKACKSPVSELLLHPQTRRGSTSASSSQAGPQGDAISLPQSDCHSVFHHPQSLPRSARPDLILEVGLEPPAADLASSIPCEDQQIAGNPTSRIPCEDLSPVILEIPSGSPDLEEELPRAPESPQCPDTPGKWFRPPARSPPRSRSSSPPSPRRPSKRSPSYGRWCE